MIDRNFTLSLHFCHLYGHIIAVLQGIMLLDKLPGILTQHDVALLACDAMPAGCVDCISYERKLGLVVAYHTHDRHTHMNTYL